MLTLPLVIDAVVVFTRRYETRVEESKRYLTESAIMRVIPIAAVEPIPAICFSVFAEFLDLRNNFPTKPDPVLQKKIVELTKIQKLNDLSLSYLNDEGRYIIVAAYREEIIGDDVTDYFQQPNPFEIAKEYKDPVATYLSSRLGFDLFAVSAYGVKSPEGKPVGIITTVNSSKSVHAKKMIKEDDTYYPVRFAILNPSSIVVLSTDPTLLYQYLEKQTIEQKKVFATHQGDGALGYLPKEPLEILEPMHEGDFMRFVWEGREQFGVVEPMPWWQYSLLAYASKEGIYDLPLKDFVGVFTSYSIILILGGLLTYFITRRWMRPVQVLGAIMLRVKEGDLQARYVPDAWSPQINALGNVFNEMLENLLSNRDKAEKERVQRDIFAQELELGKQAQEKLLTEPTQNFGNLDVAQQYIPANQVGGDFYDIFRKPNGKLVLAVADASGKGVLACCYSLAARNILRTLATYDDDVAEVLFRGNNLFCADTGETGMFVTVELAQYDYESRILSYHSLGHNPGILCRKDGTIERLSSGDMAMGVLVKEKKAQAAEKSLEVGDVLVLYTDGVSEMHNPESELFGEERLIETIKQHQMLSAREIAEKIEEETKKFANGREQFDDFTLIVVRVNG